MNVTFVRWNKNILAHQEKAGATKHNAQLSATENIIHKTACRIYKIESYMYKNECRIYEIDWHVLFHL